MPNNNDTATLDIESLLYTLSEFGISLTKEQRLEFEKYCRAIAQTNPKNAHAEIATTIQKIAHKSLTSAEHTKLANAERRNKWEQMLIREKARELLHNPPPLTKKQIRRIIARIAAKLKTKFKVKISKELRKKAAEEFQKEVKLGDSPVEKANSALLNVIKVGIAGGVRIVVAYSWGNLLNVPDVDPYHGLAAIDNANRIGSDLNEGDTQGMEFSAIMNVLKIGTINPMLAAFLDKENAPIDSLVKEESAPRSIFSTPTLSPMPYVDGEND